MTKPWLQSYPEGVPEEIDFGGYNSILDIFEQSCADYRERTAYINFDRKITYGELDRLSRDFAAWLQSRGMRKGDRIALMMPNILQYPIALFGAMRAGMVIVNTNPMYTARELRHQLQDSGARAIVIVENFAHVLEKVRGEVPVEEVITTRIGDLLGFPKGFLVNFALKYVKKAIPGFSLPGATRFTDALSGGAGLTLDPAPLQLDDLAFLQYTGGTTGVAKGAMLTHRNLVANMLQSKAWMIPAGIGQDVEYVITALPLYHIFALTANCLVYLAVGGVNVLITNPRDLPGLVNELKKVPFTVFPGVNTLFNGLLNTPGFADLDFSTLKGALGGGMAVQPAIAAQWEEITGKPILQGYGLTETSPIATANAFRDGFNGSIGLPVPGTDLMIADDDGNPLPIGEIGEICIKGPQVMEGYWQRPQETADVMLPGGWLKTGDVGRMDEDGFTYIEDRKKDMILVSGFNVYPNEIENVVVEMDGILEAAAIGIPDEKSGEVVKLFAVRTDPNVTEQDIIDYCRENLTNYKRPRQVEFRDELPKTNVGKILRRALRDD